MRGGGRGFDSGSIPLRIRLTNGLVDQQIRKCLFTMLKREIGDSLASNYKYNMRKDKPGTGHKNNNRIPM